MKLKVIEFHQHGDIGEIGPWYVNDLEGAIDAAWRSSLEMGGKAGLIDEEGRVKAIVTCMYSLNELAHYECDQNKQAYDLNPVRHPALNP